ncbi:MAG TPA: glycosyltransferase family 87 protein [Solirubrobacteraceae bacterium]|nr:glycosyltransferase family 87 protein [Solirubrobacteraceae bacterium]
MSIASLSARSRGLRTLDPGRLRRPLIALLLIAGELLLVGGTFTHVGNRLLYDFQGGLFDAGRAILHGHTPYRPGFLAHQAAVMHHGGVAVGESADHPFSVPVYPALANVLIVPLALLPFWLAGTLFTLASPAAMVGGLRLLGVTDRRCVAVALVSWPFLFGLFLGAIGPFLLLGAGLAWRLRARLWPAGAALAAIIAAKVFPWPMAVWLLITGRRRAFAVTVALGIVLTFAAWALIGFDGLAQYPRMLSEVSSLQENRADSLVGVLVIAGIGSGIAHVAGFVLAGILLVVAWRIARTRPDGERPAFGLTVIAALTATPIVWQHYMVLLFVPVALLSPRWSRAWLIPVVPGIVTALSWLVIPGNPNYGPYSAQALREILPWLAAEAMIVWMLLAPDRARDVVASRRPRGRTGHPALSD